MLSFLQIQIVWKKAFLRIRSLNCDLWISIWVSISLSSFSLRNSCYLLVDLVLCPENLAFVTVRLGPHEYGWKKYSFYTPFAARILPTFISSGNRLSFSFFRLFSRKRFYLGRWDLFTLFGTLLVSMELFNITTGIFPVSLADTRQKCILFIYLFILL